jgi:hypothetical protein
VVLAAAAKEGTSLGSSSIPEQRYFGFSNTKSVCLPFRLRRHRP